MITLISPVLWDGHLIPAGTYISLAECAEERLIQAGNAVCDGNSIQEAAQPEAFSPAVLPSLPDSPEREEADAPELTLGRGVPEL